MMTFVTQNVALLIFVHSYKMLISASNILIRYFHNFAAVLFFLSLQINIRNISKEYLIKKLC